MSASKRQGERLTVLLLIGLIAINYPIMALFSKTVLWFGIPALYLYLFTFWVVFIGLAAAIMEKREPPESNTNHQGNGDSV